MAGTGFGVTLRIGTLLALLFVVAPPPVRADADAYQEVIGQALREFDAGNWLEARVHFQRAHELQPSARTWRGLGIADYEQRRYALAWLELREAASDTRSPLTSEQSAQVADLLDQCRRYIGRYRLKLVPDTATLTVDDAAPVRPGSGETLLLDLGERTLRAEAPGHEPLSRRVMVQGGEDGELVLELAVTAGAGAGTPVNPSPSASSGTAASAGVAGPTAATGPAPGEAKRDGGSSVFGKWWFWAIAGAAVAGGVVTGVVLASGDDAEAPATPNSGVVIMTLGAP